MTDECVSIAGKMHVSDGLVDQHYLKGRGKGGGGEAKRGKVCAKWGCKQCAVT